MTGPQTIIDTLYATEHRKIFATLVRLLGDFDLAEEAVHDAFTVALERWPTDGVPDNPVAWLISTGRNKAIDRLRRQQRWHPLTPQALQALEEDETSVGPAGLGLMGEQAIEDDRLRLIFTCCHPAIDLQVRVPLTLREVCGLSTEAIASAFLTSPATLAQRIVRGKHKIRAAGIPYEIPEARELPERLDAVLAVIYLIFNEGYSASSGESALRGDLSAEAIRLARLLLALLPDPEVMGLLALMLLHESRRQARVNADNDIVLMEDQDRSLWDTAMIDEGQQWVREALRSRRFGFYTLQAAISAVHAEAKRAEETDWGQIVALYNLLMSVEASPVIELNRAVAVAMRDGPAAGLGIIDALLARGELAHYHLAHAARGELLFRMGEYSPAAEAFQQALALTQQLPEQRHLQRRLGQIESAQKK